MAHSRDSLVVTNIAQLNSLSATRVRREKNFDPVGPAGARAAGAADTATHASGDQYDARR